MTLCLQICHFKYIIPYWLTQIWICAPCLHIIAHMDMDMSPCLHIISHMDMDMTPCPHII